MLRKFKLKPLLVISFNDFNNFLSFLTIHRFVWFQCNHLYDIKPGKWAVMYSCVKGLPTNCLSGVGTVPTVLGFVFVFPPFILAFLFINSLFIRLGNLEMYIIHQYLEPYLQNLFSFSIWKLFFGIGRFFLIFLLFCLIYLFKSEYATKLLMKYWMSS